MQHCLLVMQNNLHHLYGCTQVFNIVNISILHFTACYLQVLKSATLEFLYFKIYACEFIEICLLQYLLQENRLHQRYIVYNIQPVTIIGITVIHYI